LLENSSPNDAKAKERRIKQKNGIVKEIPSPYEL